MKKNWMTMPFYSHQEGPLNYLHQIVQKNVLFLAKDFDVHLDIGYTQSTDKNILDDSY